MTKQIVYWRSITRLSLKNAKVQGEIFRNKKTKLRYTLCSYIPYRDPRRLKKRKEEALEYYFIEFN